MKVYGPASFLNAALQHVQSESIRAWAVTPHNKPIFIKLAKLALTVVAQVPACVSTDAVVVDEMVLGPDEDQPCVGQACGEHHAWNLPLPRVVAGEDLEI